MPYTTVIDQEDNIQVYGEDGEVEFIQNWFKLMKIPII